MTEPLKKLRPTAREFLVRVAGNAHAIHSVVRRLSRDRRRRSISILCSCEQVFDVPDDDDSREALRNVPGEWA